MLTAIHFQPFPLTPRRRPPELAHNLKLLVKCSSKLLIHGGRQLSGHVHISGSKNAALAVLAGTLCCSQGQTVLHGVPELSDTRVMASILRSVGARVEERGGGVVVVDACGVCGGVEPGAEDVGRIRAGIFVLGPLVGRFGAAAVALPGGCRIGARPIDLYIRGLVALGAVVELRDGKVCVQAANGRGLVGGHFHLDFPSVGATETLMMAASVADGVTVLSNVAQEPEVIDLAQFLIACGAIIEGVGTSRLVITGRRLQSAEFTIIPDRIEAGTFMAAAAITRSRISLSPVIPNHLTSIIDTLSAAGCRIAQTKSKALEVSVPTAKHSAGLQGFRIKTSPYPGFPTDLQPQVMALLTTCNGLSVVEESVFENRMHHVKELQKLGAKIHIRGDLALVEGRKHRSGTLSGAQVAAADLRGGAALVLAGLAAKGVTEVTGVEYIDRGYVNFEQKLASLGADIERVNVKQPGYQSISV